MLWHKPVPRCRPEDSYPFCSLSFRLMSSTEPSQSPFPCTGVKDSFPLFPEHSIITGCICLGLPIRPQLPQGWWNIAEILVCPTSIPSSHNSFPLFLGGLPGCPLISDNTVWVELIPVPGNSDLAHLHIPSPWSTQLAQEEVT